MQLRPYSAMVIQGLITADISHINELKIMFLADLLLLHDQLFVLRFLRCTGCYATHILMALQQVNITGLRFLGAFIGAFILTWLCGWNKPTYLMYSGETLKSVRYIISPLPFNTSFHLMYSDTKQNITHILATAQLLK